MMKCRSMVMTPNLYSSYDNGNPFAGTKNSILNVQEHQSNADCFLQL
jgi:hypothetical protein